MNALIDALLSTQTPLLPAAWLARLYLSLGWAMVLGMLVLWIGGRLRRSRARFAPAAALVVFLWCLWPGAGSPSYWLGLAFRAPSLLTVLLCGLWLLGHFKPSTTVWLPADALRAWAGVLVVLGWVLLLDTLAFWPTSLYALGFAPMTLGLVALVGVLPWLLWPAKPGVRGVALLLGLALLSHAVLRLPSGNVWDAVLDPWLWIVLQAGTLQRGVRRWRQRTA